MADATRLDVAFASGDDVCAAWLYLPERADDAPAPPVLVMAHGLGGTREGRLDAFAERFRDAGYAALVFDYRHFGASGGEPRQVLDIGRQLADWHAALRYVRTRSDVDVERIVLWGTSFSGGHVLSVAAKDRHVAAVIAQGLFTDGMASAMVADRRASLKVLPKAIADRVAARLGRDPVYVATAGPPGSCALMTAPDAYDGYLGLVPDGVEFRNEIAARIAFDVPLYQPGRRAADIDVPVLFCICETDSVAPAAAATKYAAQARRGEVRTYADGHFAIYVGEGFERVVADQLDFLARHVPVR